MVRCRVNDIRKTPQINLNTRLPESVIGAIRRSAEMQQVNRLVIVREWVAEVCNMIGSEEYEGMGPGAIRTALLAGLSPITNLDAMISVTCSAEFKAMVDEAKDRCGMGYDNFMRMALYNRAHRYVFGPAQAERAKRRGR